MAKEYTQFVAVVEPVVRQGAKTREYLFDRPEPPKFLQVKEGPLLVRTGQYAEEGHRFRYEEVMLLTAPMVPIESQQIDPGSPDRLRAAFVEKK